MPIIILLLLAALVATFGFWNTLQAVLGAIGVIILLVVLAVAASALLIGWMMKR
jgi:uncharacterized membrane protein